MNSDAEEFEPRNDLERRLLAMHQERLAPEQFMHALLDSQVFMPVKDQLGIDGFQASQRAVPLSLEDEDGVKILILFTSPERGKTFLQDFPGFGGGILEDLKWVLQKMGAGYGIAINPGWEVGIDLDPDTVTQLARQAAAQAGD
ncbi:MAG: SseB family protein [Gammaproteobacteria bacterium]